MLYDRDFLKKLDQQRNKTIYGRVTALQFNEQPITTLEGVITGGSINIDGSSAVRRTCSLTMVSETVDVGGYYWGLNTKFKLEIGVKNTVDTTKYPETIWFNQGVFIITSFSTSLSTTNYTINLQGKDKMCLLNGDIGGSLNASVQFDSWEQEMADGSWKVEKYPIKDIIRDVVHQYGGEPLSNIIINDLDDKGLELLEYRYDQPMFLIRKANETFYENATLDPNTSFDYCVQPDGTEVIDPKIGAKDEKTGEWLYSYDLLVESLIADSHPTIFTRYDPQDTEEPVKNYCVAKIEYGETAGYRLTDMIYPDELIGNIGESVTSVLDKIRNLLGQFEYFYDLDGRFVFQKKSDYVNTLWSPQVEVEDGVNYVENMAYSTKYTYSFTGNELITSFNNTPNLNNLRNDYSVWGSKKDGTGKDLLIHMRYAIDEKPVYYKAYSGKEYTTYPSESKSIYSGEWNDASTWGAHHRYKDNTLILSVDRFNSDNKYGWKGIYYDLKDVANGQTIHVTGTLSLISQGLRDMKMRVLYCGTLDQHKGPAGVIDQIKPQLELKPNENFHFSFTKKANVNYLYFLLQGWETDNLLENQESYCIAGLTDIGIIQGATPMLQTDWREIIYQMQKDYRKHNREDNFQLQIIKNNPPNEEMQFSGYVTGQTGYEQYYIDVEGFWRQLYYPKYAYEEDLIKKNQKISEKTNTRESLVVGGNVTDDVLYESLTKEIDKLKAEKLEFIDSYAEEYYAEDQEHKFWHKNVFEAPHLLNYWLDFLDADGELNQFSCKAVGSRPKAVNDSNVKCIYFRETPAIIFATASEMALHPEMTGYRYFQVGQWSDMFSVSAQGKCAKEAIDELLYQHSYCSESAEITALPVYYLEPNSRVYVHDDTTHISGDYIVSKISIPFTYNGTMKLSTTKAAEQII